MAKDRSNGSKPKEKSLHFFVPLEFHRRLKMVCAYEGKTLKDYVVGALQKALAGSEKNIQRGNAPPAVEPSISSNPETSG